ncbi:MAG TPA: alpha-amylase family protein, partial [Longimicrobium sp.]|nr:alpha-amylase family protein [Longimicrobium sp.]
MIEDLWYKNAVIYSLSLETFMDGNGDGCGDFEGLVRRLDYLEALGIDAIWLGPFQPSPNRDNGYDVSDFYGVDPRYGSSGDFVEFMHHANSRGIRVLMDLVVNHTSDRHPWFQEARDPESPRRDWYVWSKQRPKDMHKGMVFPGVQKSTWTKDPESGEYYYHRFYDFQPDLNVDNPDVRTEIRRIMGYWLQLGVSGFRMDAVPFVIEGSPDGKGGTPPLHFEYLRQMRSFLQWRTAGAIMLGEANVLPAENQKYFGKQGDGIHMMFNFFVNQHVFFALAAGDTRPLADALKQTRALPPSAQWAQFLRNHDELDLGRLTEEQRARVLERFGPDQEMQLYGRGIRRRLASMLGERSRIELAYSLMFSLPGTPVIRYGDEIGMGEDLRQKERDAVRTPMQWSGERNAGFSAAETTVKPVIDHGPYSCDHVNVEAQRRDPDSLLNWTVGMIRLRKECPEIGWGSWRILPAGSASILAMCYEWRGNAVVVLHNFDRRPREARLRVPAEGGEHLSNLIQNEEVHADAKGVHHVALEAYGYRWYR